MRAALPRAAGVQHRPPSCSGRPVRPSARLRVSPTPLLAARGWHLRAGRGRRGQQCPPQGGPLLGPQALPRLSAGKDCRRARGLAAGARRCLYLSGGRLGSRAESQVLTGPRGPASAPRVRRSVRRDRTAAPTSPPRLSDAGLPHPALRGSPCLCPARPVLTLPGGRAWLPPLVLGPGPPAGPGAPGEGLLLSLACRPRAQRLPARLPPPGGRRPRLWELLPGPPLGPAALTEQPVPCCQASLSAGHSCDRPPVGVPRVHRHATVGPGLGGPRAVGWAGSGTLCSSATRAPAAPSSVCVPSCPQAVGSAPASPRQPGCAGFLGPDSSYGWDVGVDPASSRAGVPLSPWGQSAPIRI